MQAPREFFPVLAEFSLLPRIEPSLQGMFIFLILARALLESRRDQKQRYKSGTGIFWTRMYCVVFERLFH